MATAILKIRLRLLTKVLLKEAIKDEEIENGKELSYRTAGCGSCGSFHII